MFLDTDLNSASTVLANLYSNFFNCAMKVHQYLKCLPAKKRPRSSFLIGTMQDLMEMAYTLIKSQERRHPRDETVRSMGHYQCAVTKTQVRWLAATAFQTALTRKQTQYQELLAWLKAELGSVSLPSPNEVLRLKRAVKDGGKAFEGWRY
ncbi:MAG: FKBP12-associated protein [Chaenotheca gracillima]|nr:MAG: FKBP12-associated protein [Chaenotheca gracillima]